MPLEDSDLPPAQEESPLRSSIGLPPKSWTRGWLALSYLTGTLLILLAALCATAALSRFADGPFSYFPAGPFTSGEVYRGAEPDWSHCRDDDVVEFKLLSPPRSRRALIVLVDGKPFTHSGFRNSPLGQYVMTWANDALVDPRALIRHEGLIYERSLKKIEDRDLALRIMIEFERKYGFGNTPEGFNSGDMRLFEFAPRQTGKVGG